MKSGLKRAIMIIEEEIKEGGNIDIKTLQYIKDQLEREMESIKQ